MLPRVKKVQPLADYQLLLSFEGGEKRIFNVVPWLDKGVFRALRDKNLFRTVKVSFDTIEWANGADLCPEVLYADSNLIESGIDPQPHSSRTMAVAEAHAAYGPKRRKTPERQRGA